MQSGLASIFGVVLVLCTSAWKPITITNQTHCIKNSKIADTLIYSHKHIKLKARDCDTTQSCSYAQIDYPVFPGRALLNDTIQNRLLRLCNNASESKAATTLPNAATNFLILYYQNKIGNLNRQVQFDLSCAATVISQSPKILVLETGFECYSGGAHPDHENYFVNWDIKNNRSVQLADILINGYQLPLTRIAGKKYMAAQGLTGEAAMKDDLAFNRGVFKLNDNFYITGKGLVFFFNTYEIKPYAYGDTVLLIPYRSIKQLLRPNTVISQYIK